MLRAHLAKRRDVEIVYSDENRRAARHRRRRGQGAAPFRRRAFLHPQFRFHLGRRHSSALPAMLRACGTKRGWMAVAAGRDGDGAWAMKARGDFRLCDPGSCQPRAGPGDLALRLSRRADRASAPVRRCARTAPSPPTSCGTAPSPSERLYGTRLDGVWIHVGTPRGARRGRSVSRPAATRREAAAVFTIAASAPFARDAGARA